ncbi:peptidase C13 family-domain-containing protein [Pyronema domesticum]|uniref:Similar to GPI-anchor transamidase acc. no. P49018 n=1 Tax=Pyronema omphalodes (strain CBS 100304) TaxID=1076935 RepID=U4LF54_PYROM|nr:peptidase C13 family-domain-containing protein [Pyronema domesticum]CCX13576.1 Similar to GPI-anchor transamidase; acc. no. P49018 [Pyronema omphalodes CBS 100304]
MKLRITTPIPTLLFTLFALLLQLSCVHSQHTSNWAVLVSTSRFWFNYRHLANVLSMYRTVKRLGIPDSQIILMLADDVACNPRNVFPASVFNNADRGLDLYGDNIEVDYRGYEVTVENFIRLLTDRVEPDTPRSKRLLTDDRSNIFVYMTGHGGNEFLKFQDAEEISAFDIADAFEQMWEKKRYHQMLFMIDTCQANTMYSKFYSPNILATGSSKLDQSSYSHHADNDVGVAVIDRYTYYNLEFLENNVKNASSKHTMKDLFDSYDTKKIHSDPGVRTDLFHRNLDEVLITDFFGNVQNVETDGVGEDEKWKVDVSELARLAANITSPKKQQKEIKVEELKGKAEKKISAFKVEEKASWTQGVVGATALVACALAWFGGSFMPK